MSERQEMYRYAVDTVCATQQHNMANGMFDTVRPHLEVERKTPDFLAALHAFLTNPDDPTGLRLFNLREQASDLKRNIEEASGLLAQIV